VGKFVRAAGAWQGARILETNSLQCISIRNVKRTDFSFFENVCQANACASDEHKLDVHELREALPCHSAHAATSTPSQTKGDRMGRGGHTGIASSAAALRMSVEKQ
jgi:hypothetical protein